MATRLNPYLSFTNNARDAMQFYQSVFGGELTMNTFGEFQMATDPAEQNKIMHAQLESPGGLVLMASDTPDGIQLTRGNETAISLSGDDEEELTGYWQKLSDGASVRQELEKAPWGDSFGMLTDQFGVNWMVNIAGKHD
jgi:PhnB protein